MSATHNRSSNAAPSHQAEIAALKGLRAQASRKPFDATATGSVAEVAVNAQVSIANELFCLLITIILL
jgi:hypothetical protein